MIKFDYLLIESTGRYRNPGASYTVTPTNYVVDGYTIAGSRTVANNGFNASNNLVFSINSSVSITDALGNSSTYFSTREREWINGYGTNIFTNGLSGWTDDVYSITGTAQGTSSNGVNYTVNITNPLIAELSCPHLTSGTIEIDPTGLPTRTFDWGNGNCDNSATVSVNGFTFSVTL